MPRAKTTKQNANSKAAGSSKSVQRRLDPNISADATSFLDDWARRDIAGIVFIILGIIAMLIAILPENNAVLTGIASSFVHLVFGIGAYILPFVLVVIGITFLFKSRRRRISLRASVGLALIFIALLGIFALFTPVEVSEISDASALFYEKYLQAYGGYIGAAIAWAGILAFGKVITGVILVGLIIIGIVIIGFSISKLLESLKIKGQAHMQNFRDNHAGSGTGANTVTPPFARVRKIKDDYDDPFADERDNSQNALDFDTTGVIRSSAASSAANMIPINSADAHSADSSFNSDITMTLTDAQTRLQNQGGETGTLTRKLGDKTATSKAKSENASRKKSKSAQASTNPKPQAGFVLPPMSMLAKPNAANTKASKASDLSATAALLQETLEDFGIGAKVAGWVAGPTVTLFKIELPSGLRVSRITGLNADLALALAAPAVRIFAPIPGTNYVGIEVPNKSRQTVLLSEVLSAAPVGPLQIAIGKDVEGNAIVSDLAKMPHLLIGGTTGSGKSVSINAMIMSILMRATPAEVRFIMIDPKRVEFTPYNGIPHLYVPVVTEPKEAASALAWGVAEMDRRLKMFSKVGVRNIGQYNAKINSMSALCEDDTNDTAQNSDEDSLEQVPYIVIVIDELADLMMSVGKEVEYSICRIAQLARAAGIHLIVATQRPSTNVVTGLIKSNITNRIAFNVASSIDSRVILDTTGAEDLIGLGDLLLSKPELAKPQRIQGCYVSEDEINAVVEAIKEQGEPEYHHEILNTNTMSLGDTSPSGGAAGSDDPLIWDAAEIVVSSGMGSTSNIQRRLKVGYSRAGRIMDQLEEKGIVGPANGSKPREVYIDQLELESLKALEQA